VFRLWPKVLPARDNWCRSGCRIDPAA